MQPPMPLDYISQLIQGGYTDDAQRGLASVLSADPGNAAAWALTAWIAPDSERCTQALQMVITTSHDQRLTRWAQRGLKLIEHIGTLDEQAPPVMRIPQAASSPMERSENRAPKKPALEPGSPAHTLGQAGGGIMILGMLIMIIAIVSPQVADLFNRTCISAGGCGITLIAIGAVVAYVGYQRRPK